LKATNLPHLHPETKGREPHEGVCHLLKRGNYGGPRNLQGGKGGIQPEVKKADLAEGGTRGCAKRGDNRKARRKKKVKTLGWGLDIDS